jgi:CRP-like cAMP-binding protein
MYVVIQGSLEVLVKDKKVRDIGRGDAVGELALLYRYIYSVKCNTILTYMQLLLAIKSSTLH